MSTVTDTMWTTRLEGIMPPGWMDNVKTNFTANAGFLDTMINRIGMTVIAAVDSPFNPFSKYTGPVMDFGDTVQKYKVDFIKGQVYDSDNTNPFTTTKNKPYAQYATIDDTIQYHDRISEYEFKKAFVSDSTLGDFVAAKLDALYESDALDKFTKWKKYISDYSKYASTTMVEADATDDDVFAGNLWDTLRSFANDKFRFPNSSYNVAGQTAISPSVDIIMRKKDKLLVDNYLKGVYNLEKTDVDANFIYIDDFASEGDSALPSGAEEMVALVTDSRGLQYFPRTPQSGSIYNPAALNIEYYLTIQGTFCFDKFRNMMPIFKAE